MFCLCLNCEFETAKIVYSYKFNLLPKIFDNYFSYAKSCHSRTTRFSLKSHLTIPLFKSNRTQRSIKYRTKKPKI